MVAKILVVDDAITIRLLAKKALFQEGYEVQLCVDGLDALNTAKQAQFDLVISDINMPNMNGFALVKALRALPEYENVPIFMLTTESSKEVAMEGKRLGVNAWVVKPFNPAKLLNAIRAMLAHSESA